jgi:hypothetical protein
MQMSFHYNLSSFSSLGIDALPSTNFQNPWLESIMRILNFQRRKLPPLNFSMTFKDSIWKDDILLNTNVKTNTLYISIQMNYKWENFKFKKNSNVWKPHFKSLPLNHYMWQNKTFTKKSSNTWKTLLHKLEILVETCNNGKYLCLAHLKLEAFNNLKTSFSTNLKLQRWNFEQFEKTPFHTFSNLNIQTFNKLKKFSST